MDRIMGVVSKVPLWVRTVVASVVIIGIAVVVDRYVQDYVHRIARIVPDDYSCVFQIDSVQQEKNKFFLEGWVFKLKEDSIKNDFEIILYDYNGNKRYRTEVTDTLRTDVNEYFLCEFDYSNSGFTASIELEKLDLENVNYEVLIQSVGGNEVYKTGIYIHKGEVMYAKPEEYVTLEVEGTDIEAIVNEGILRVYRPDEGVYVYQRDENLYWIFDEKFKFESSNTYMELQLNTTQPGRLPEYRKVQNLESDNIRFCIESMKIEAENTGKYVVAVITIPKQYSIEKFWCGKYNKGWTWIEYFRPWYEF